MQRVVILGRGGAGKSTAATRLGLITGLPVLELDGYFWSPDLTPMPLQEWVETQQWLTASPRWIMDGDLGPFDSLDTRLAAADTVLVLDFALLRCAWRAANRSREHTDFWWWVLTWRRRSRPAVMAAVADHAASATVHVLRTPRALRQFFTELRTSGSPGRPS